MKFGVCIPHYGIPLDVDNLTNMAIKAEEMGFDSVWVTDHIIVPHQIPDRTLGRSASSRYSQVPSPRHLRKYHQTVPQGGRPFRRPSAKGTRCGPSPKGWVSLATRYANTSLLPGHQPIQRDYTSPATWRPR